MEEQFILRVPPSVAERIDRLLTENASSSSDDKLLDLSFSEDGRSGTFMIGNERFPTSLLDLPSIHPSWNLTKLTMIMCLSKLLTLVK